MLAAAPASAHTVSGGSANDYTATLGPLTPTVAGVTLRTVENNTRLQLTAAAGVHVVVLGYGDEPYLRVGPDGTFENRLSQSTYENRTYTATQIGGTLAAKSLPPQWVRTGGGRILIWHDHREHNSGPNPPEVRADPSHRHEIGTRDVVIEVEGARHAAALTLTYLPPPSALPLWVLAGLLAVGTTALALLPRSFRLVGVVVAGLVGCDVVHSVGSGLVKAGTTGERLSAFASGNAAEAVAWALGLIGAGLVARGRLAGCYCAGTAAAVIAAVGGLGDAATLSSATAPFAGPVWWARLLTAVTIGVGVGVLGASAVGVVRLDRAERAALAQHALAREPVSGKPVSQEGSAASPATPST